MTLSLAGGGCKIKGTPNFDGLLLSSFCHLFGHTLGYSAGPFLFLRFKHQMAADAEAAKSDVCSFEQIWGWGMG